MKIKKAVKLTKEKLPKKRFDHSLRVAETAVKLAEIYQRFIIILQVDNT